MCGCWCGCVLYELILYVGGCGCAQLTVSNYSVHACVK